MKSASRLAGLKGGRLTTKSPRCCRDIGCMAYTSSTEHSHKPQQQKKQQQNADDKDGQINEDETADVENIIWLPGDHPGLLEADSGSASSASSEHELLGASASRCDDSVSNQVRHVHEQQGSCTYSEVTDTDSVMWNVEGAGDGDHAAALGGVDVDDVQCVIVSSALSPSISTAGTDTVASFSSQSSQFNAMEVELGTANSPSLCQEKDKEGGTRPCVEHENTASIRIDNNEVSVRQRWNNAQLHRSSKFCTDSLKAAPTLRRRMSRSSDVGRRKLEVVRPSPRLRHCRHVVAHRSATVIKARLILGPKTRMLVRASRQRAF